jgi:hypothetical protein
VVSHWGAHNFSFVQACTGSSEVKFWHALGFAFALIAAFIALDMTGVTRGLPDGAVIAGMALTGLAFAIVISKRSQRG